MLCPKGHDIKLSKQVAKWDKDWGSDECLTSTFSATFMLDDLECGRRIGMVSILGLNEDDFKEIDTEIGKVWIPEVK